MTQPDVTVVLPVYNEAEGVEVLILDLLETLQQEGLNFEIIPVDDGSRDRSGEILRALQVKYPEWVRVATHVLNKGYGAALRTGVRLARGKVIVCMDADGQHQAKDLPKLLAKIPPYDMVVGARTKEYTGKWFRNLANRFYNRFASWLTRYPILDLTSGYRAMRRQAVQHFLPIYPSGFSAPTTVTMAFLKAGYSVAYIPVEVLPRKHGKSKINLFQDGSRFLIIILRMIMLFDPLRIFFPISATLLGLGILAMIVGILAAARPVVPGSSVVLFIAAVLSMLLGLVSNQISNASIPYYGDEFVHLYEGQDEPPDDT